MSPPPDRPAPAPPADPGHGFEARPSTVRLSTLSLAAAAVTIGMKATAYHLTGSAGLFSDALESLVHPLTAVTAYLAVGYAARPADRSHAFGHEKIEYFSGGLAGAVVAVTGLATGWYAVGQLVDPKPLEAVGAGAAVAVAAAGVNLAVGRVLVREGRRRGSVALAADGQHLMADVWTTAGVAAGLGAVAATGLAWIDGLVALAIGGHITAAGFGLVRQAFHGLMDHALPAAEQAQLRDVIRSALPPGADFHLLRTRHAGRRKFADFHLLVAGGMTVRDAHRLAHQVEAAIRAAAPEVAVTVHVEPIDERSSWESVELTALGEAPFPPSPPAG